MVNNPTSIESVIQKHVIKIASSTAGETVFVFMYSLCGLVKHYFLYKHYLLLSTVDALLRTTHASL